MIDWKATWNQRYSENGFAYGSTPNEFFKAQISNFEKGRILFPAEGEGRNAVYAAHLGNEVFAFDLSEVGKEKAEKLANQVDVSITYEVGDPDELSYSPASFDGIVLIFAHFPADRKSKIHKHLRQLLKSGGFIIFEAFSKNHIPLVTQNPAVGGPKDIDQLFSIEEIQSDFEDFEVEILEESTIQLQEGKYHNGIGSVIRFVGRKR